MSRVVRNTAKRLAQKLVGRSDLRGFVRKQKLWLSKKIHRRPVSIADLRQRLIDLGVTPGRTLWVQSSHRSLADRRLGSSVHFGCR